jgi:drug/metabolite transporter (DMT)-like permease
MNNIQIALLGGMMGMFGYGICDFIIKRTIDRIGALQTLLYAQFIGAGFVSLYLVKEPSLPILSAFRMLCILLFGVFSAVAYLALFKALEVGKLSIVSPITSSFAMISATVSFLFFGESFSQLKILALSLVIIGIVLTCFDIRDLRSRSSAASLSKGVPQAIVSAVVFGLFLPFWDRFVEGEGWVVWIMLERLIVAVFLVIYSSFSGKEITLPRQGRIVFWLILIALFDAVGFFGNTWALSASVDTTSIVAAVSSAYPLVAGSLAFGLLKERLSINQYIGIVVTISGLVFMPFA